MFFKRSIFNFFGSVNVNNTVHTVKDSLILENNKVIVDGVDVTEDMDKVSIVINGDVKSMEVFVCKEISVTGSVGFINNTHGNVSCANVEGDVKTTHGDINCSDVTGDVDTVHGKVNCGSIKGKVETNMGNVEVDGSVGGSVKTNMGNISIKNKK